MRDDEFWYAVEMRSERTKGRGRIGPLRVALLFGTLAIAMALLLPPMVAGDRSSSAMLAYTSGHGVDMMATGSIPRSDSRVYTERRSILQAPGSVCILNGLGRQQGDC